MFEIVDPLYGTIFCTVEHVKSFADDPLPENHLRVADDVLGVGVAGHFELESTYEIVAAQRPEVGLLNVQNAVKLAHLKKKIKEILNYNHSNERLFGHNLCRSLWAPQNKQQ